MGVKRKVSAHSQRYASLVERLLANSYVDRETDCWVWTGSRNNRGYPRLSMRLPGRLNPASVYAHRISLMVFAGRLSTAHESHHRCLNQRCINPDHLEATTRKIHRKRHQQLKQQKQSEHGDRA